MPVVSSVKLNLNKKALKDIDRRYKEGVFDMAMHMASQARANAPYITGALRNSIRVDRTTDETAILVRAGGIVSSGTWQGKEIRRMVNYAWKVEQKSSRPHYMKRAQEQVMAGDWQTQFFKGVTK